jgi:lysophospholipase
VQARGPVVFMQGRAEFHEKYEELFVGLADRGFDVYAMDWRGQGASDRMLKNPHKGYVDDFATYLTDLEDWLATTDIGTEAPFALMGHSMGGHLALRYAMEKPHRVTALVAMAPMMDIHMPPGMRPLSIPIIALSRSMGWMEKYAPTQTDFNLSLFSFMGNALTHDEKRFEIIKQLMRRSPEVQLGGVTVGWISAALRSMQAVRRALLTTQEVPFPARVLLAEGDRVVRSEVAAQVMTHINGLEVEMVANARHEIPQELPAVRARMWAAVDQILSA